MKVIHKINKYVLILNLLLYLTLIGGAYAQLFLGPLQLILAVIVTLRYYRYLNKENKALIQKYWVMVAIDFVLIGMYYLCNKEFDSAFLTLISLFIYPMIIACYFVHVTYSIRKQLNR